MKPTLIFFGNEILSSAKDYNEAPIFESLLKHHFSIEALIIKNTPKPSRTQMRPKIIDLAHSHKIAVITIQTSSQISQAIQTKKSQLAVVASFGCIIPAHIIDSFQIGMINVHPSLLPKYRGTTPIETSLINGDAQTGVSLIQLNPKLDAGKIYAQKSLKIRPQATKLTLTQDLAKLASNLLVAKLELIASQKLQPYDQDDQLASYTTPIKASPPFEGLENTADYWQKHIVAFKGCPNNKFKLNHRVVDIIEAHASSLSETARHIYSKSQGLIYLKTKADYLGISLLKPQGGKIMTAQDFVNGHFKDIKMIA